MTVELMLQVLSNLPRRTLTPEVVYLILRL